MPRRPVLVQLSDELLEQLDRFGAERGDSRSAIVRDAVARYITEESAAARDAQLRRGYQAVPDEAPDRWAEESLEDMLDEEAW